MTKNKTYYTSKSVKDFLETLDNTQQQIDSLNLIEIMEEATLQKAQMFGNSIIGFGLYHYKYQSGHEGEAPIVGFSPRKSAISLYVYCGTPQQNELIARLGKMKKGKACIYIKKLDDIDINVLKALIKETIDFISMNYERIK